MTQPRFFQELKYKNGIPKAVEGTNYLLIKILPSDDHKSGVLIVGEDKNGMLYEFDSGFVKFMDGFYKKAFKEAFGQ